VYFSYYSFLIKWIVSLEKFPINQVETALKWWPVVQQQQQEIMFVKTRFDSEKCKFSMLTNRV